MIVVLSNCLLSWSKENEISITSTGKLIETDTTETNVVVLPIDIIRQANIKLDERLILKEIVNIQKAQIEMYKQTDTLQQHTIDNLIQINKRQLVENNSYKRTINLYKNIILGESILLVGLTLYLICN